MLVQSKKKNKKNPPDSDGRLSDCCDHCALSLSRALSAPSVGGGDGADGADGEMVVLSAERMNYTGGLMSFSSEGPSSVTQPLTLRPPTAGDP